MSAAGYKPKDSLREAPLKRALQAYIVSPLVKKYVVCSVRCLWKQAEDFNDLYEKRKKLENTLKEIKEIVFFINCITSIKEADCITCGFAF